MSTPFESLLFGELRSGDFTNVYRILDLGLDLMGIEYIRDILTTIPTEDKIQICEVAKLDRYSAQIAAEIYLTPHVLKNVVGWGVYNALAKNTLKDPVKAMRLVYDTRGDGPCILPLLVIWRHLAPKDFPPPTLTMISALHTHLSDLNYSHLSRTEIGSIFQKVADFEKNFQFTPLTLDMVQIKVESNHRIF